MSEPLSEPKHELAVRTVCIIQARMSSTRLPGKVLLPLAGRAVLAHVLERLSYCTTLSEVVVATSDDPSDDGLVQWCLDQDVKVFRGSLNDVLDRYYHCALSYQAQAVVRITADCPALDPNLVDEVVMGFKGGAYDLYYLGGEFPDGLDCAVFSFSALQRAWCEAKLPSEREHVGPYVVNHPEYFRISILNKFKGLNHYRWTLDEPRDLIFLQSVFERLQRPDGRPFLTQDLLDLLDREPELMQINNSIVRNEGLIKSLAKDKDSV
jgi:spore coat polysaccharide biosynthesis protein SpsF (cytidylyltransferase family)